MSRVKYLSLLLVAMQLVACAGPRATEQAAAPTSVLPQHTPTRPMATATLAPSPTREPSPRASATASAWPSATYQPTPSATAISTPSPTARPRTAAPSTATASPTVLAEPISISGPLQIDGAGGRIYTPCQIGGRERTCVLGTKDGALLATWEISGSLALDAGRGWLYVDRAEAGLAVVEASRGEVLRRIALPYRERPVRPIYPSPQADPAAGQALAFRENVVYVIDAERGEITRQIPFDVPVGDRCRQMDGPLGISWSAYDSARRLLYLDFVTYSCIPWIGHSIVSYDMNKGAEIWRGGVTSRGAEDVAPWDGYLYGIGWFRMGVGYRWMWKDGQSLGASSHWTYPVAGLAVDAQRGLLYQGSAERLHVFELPDMRLAFVTALSSTGYVAGYDERTDNLYLLDEGRIRVVPAARIQRPSGQALEASAMPTTTLRSLILSPTWAEDHTLFGLWEEATLLTPCWVFGVHGGPLLLSRDGGNSWLKPVGGLLDGCSSVQSLGVSPDYGRDGTLLANIVGLGLHRSTDGGRLWAPSSEGLGNLDVREILFSPTYAKDETVFLVASDLGFLYRSADGGRTWQYLGEHCESVALSPEFGEDRTLLGTWFSYPNNQKQVELRVSRDGGEQWESLGGGPAREFKLVGLAPLFAKWRVVFGYGDGTLYRSSDGGASWQGVLSAPGLEPMQMAFAPEMETNRPVFLVAREASATQPGGQGGRIYRSGDGGQTWAAVELAEGAVPLSVVVSPNYAQDGTLFVGTADARVVVFQDR